MTYVSCEVRTSLLIKSKAILVTGYGDVFAVR
jgi:hypothetical protein